MPAASSPVLPSVLTSPSAALVSSPLRERIAAASRMRHAAGLAALLMFVVTAVLLATGHSAPLSLAYPAMAVTAGALLLTARPSGYVAFTLVLWMISPFVRRVVDQQNGWNAQNPILLAPLLVCALAAFDIVRYAPRLQRAATAPFTVALLSLTCAMAVGLFVSPPSLVAYAGMSWMAPILFGLHIAMHPERHDTYREAVGRTLLVGLAAIGVYGIAQFLAPSIWDRLWMINSRMDSIGVPEPLRVRVFSTLNAPGPLAQFVSASLLIVFAMRCAVRWPAVMIGFVVLLLSLARSAWLGFAVGFLFLCVLGARRLRTRGIVAVAIGAVAVVALGTAPLPTSLASMRQTIELRVSSMGDLSMDDSFRARSYLIPAVLADIGEHPLGSGLGATLVGGAHGSAASRLADQGLYLDNGFLEILLVLGWFGGTALLLAVGSATWTAVRRALSERSMGSAESVGYAAAAVALVAQVVGGTIFAGVGGAMFWMAIALSLPPSSGHPAMARA